MKEFGHLAAIAAGLILVYLLLAHSATNGILKTLSGASIGLVKALQGR